MLSLVTVSPVITAFHSRCLSHHVFFDQVNPRSAWVGIETSIFWQCSPGTVETQCLYPLHHGPQKSRLITWRRPEVKFGQNVVKKKQHKNYQDEDKKSAINKKLILRLSFSSVNTPSLMTSWLLVIFVMVYQWLLGIFQTDSWNVLFTFVFNLLGWQLLVLLSSCSSFCSLHLLSAMLLGHWPNQ